MNKRSHSSLGVCNMRLHDFRTAVISDPPSRISWFVQYVRKPPKMIMLKWSQEVEFIKKKNSYIPSFEKQNVASMVTASSVFANKMLTKFQLDIYRVTTSQKPWRESSQESRTYLHNYLITFLCKTWNRNMCKYQYRN